MAQDHEKKGLSREDSDNVNDKRLKRSHELTEYSSDGDNINQMASPCSCIESSEDKRRKMSIKESNKKSSQKYRLKKAIRKNEVDQGLEVQEKFNKELKEKLQEFEKLKIKMTELVTNFRNNETPENYQESLAMKHNNQTPLRVDFTNVPIPSNSTEDNLIPDNAEELALENINLTESEVNLTFVNQNDYNNIFFYESLNDSNENSISYNNSALVDSIANNSNDLEYTGLQNDENTFSFDFFYAEEVSENMFPNLFCGEHRENLF